MKIIKFLLKKIIILFYNELLFNEYKYSLIYFVFFQKMFRINSNCKWPVHFTSKISNVQNIKLGIRTYPGMSPNCYIQGINGIKIGNNLRMGPGAKIISSNHDINNYDKHIKSKSIIIGNNVWLGANSIILPGVELGSNLVVGAGSIVTKSFGNNLIIGGNPAKVIRKKDEYEGKIF